MELRCAYCHAQDEALVACVECGTTLHDECWSDCGSCPTLGCRRPRAPTRRRGGRNSVWRDMVMVVLVGFGIPIGLIVGGMGVRGLRNWSGAPRIEIRNDTGRTLTNVRVVASQLDAWGLESTVRMLGPGESISVRGGHTTWEMSLRSTDLAGATLDDLRSRDDRGRYTCAPGGCSTFAIDPQGRLRTIQLTDWSGTTRSCACPEGNASRQGSERCPIELHRSDLRRHELAR